MTHRYVELSEKYPRRSECRLLLRVEALARRRGGNQTMSASKQQGPDGIWDISGDAKALTQSDCLWEHEDCPVVVRVNGALKVCACECKPCKRAWFADGRPILRSGAIVRDRQ